MKDKRTVYYKTCEHCGYKTGKSRYLDDPRCWKCGRVIHRDYMRKPNIEEFTQVHEFEDLRKRQKSE
jgi:NAD-dependent SIR2 family protein deacetylase